MAIAIGFLAVAHLDAALLLRECFGSSPRHSYNEFALTSRLPVVKACANQMASFSHGGLHADSLSKLPGRDADAPGRRW